MYVGKDFDPISPTERETFTLDFVRDVGPGATLEAESNEWFVDVVEGDDDAAGEGNFDSLATITGTQTSIAAKGFKDGCRYRLLSRATTSTGDVKELYSFIECRDPGNG